MKKIFYLLLLSSGCTNVTNTDKVVWRGEKDTLHNTYIARPYWYTNGRYVRMTDEEVHAYKSNGYSAKSLSSPSESERGGFGRTATSRGGVSE